MKKKLMKTWTMTKETGFRKLAFALVLVAGFCLTTDLARASDESDVRNVVQQVFQQLQSRDFGSVYDSLPSATRTRTSRDRFISALKRSQDRYVLDRISIGAVRVAGNLAVADTELYGRLAKPIEAEGKIVVQQYLVREDGKWRVASRHKATSLRLLKGHTPFGPKVSIRPPRLYMKQKRAWEFLIHGQEHEQREV